MVKDFDSTLTDALDLAARSAQTAGPGAARIRGRQRTMRKRIALSTASLALVAVAATAAFKVASPGHSLPPAHPTPGPSASAIGIPTSAPGEATTSAATGAPANPASSNPSRNTPSSSSSSTAIKTDPQQVVAGAWLSPGQLPFASTFDWKAIQATSQGAPIGQQLTPTVFYVSPKTQFQTLTMCGDPTSLLSRGNGAQHTDYDATTPPVSATANNVASQYIFFFANPEAAQQTYKWLQSQYSSTCFSNFPGAQFTKTASNATEATWLMTAKGTSTSPDLPEYEREYFVQRGATITYVSVTSYTQTLPTTYNDAAELGTIAGLACEYGGACQ